MPQSNIIFGYLAAAFVIFITLRGSLPTYAGFLFAVPKPAPSNTQTGAADQSQGVNQTGLNLLQSGSNLAQNAIGQESTMGTTGANLSGFGAFTNAFALMA